MKQFQSWYENHHQYCKDWKARTGGKIVGYMCTYVPEEILYAAGILPTRVLGSHEPHDVTEPHIFGMYCPFCRDVLAQGLKKRYDYIDGLTISQSCLHIRQAFTSWQMHLPLEWSYYLPMPHHVQSPRAVPFLREELVSFKKSVEEWTGKEITDEALDHAIDVYNTNRRLMRQIYELRKAENPPITGLEAMYMVVSSQFVDKADHNKELERVLQNIDGRLADREVGTRLMIIGSENDDVAFMSMAESVGATFVTDDHCTGSRYFWNEAPQDADRLNALAIRYVERPRCPTKDWPERSRIPHLLSMAKEWGVEGVILIQQKFCDPHELDIPAIKKAFEEIDIPTLFLEFDVTTPVGPFRIRVEAFLEMIRGEDLF
ncbi:benzoyl-CoA reductase, bzd-type, subunit N [Heliophilum fasciatum]|uniref:Benzoyl-CoA reductase subunit C n=1 Tax=Heliophilum fasciatum TaxID=35700 RepID=A0A4R2RNW5_9FIRM|nr:benzoyl-CoA reductase, bzd-type, subunit N [Heliophilum fasciatum]MCW2278172.1 benzoyl-CoA reductase subunit C [Heliophilum fasciatum]TCP64007.1 benzoyl-CoA reductase subunit C [Heliophilum fasciatum]